MWFSKARLASVLLNSTRRGLGDTIAVGVSGGVDSAVAAYLLKQQGYNVTGVFMRNWDEAEENGNSNCSIEADFREAKKVCSHLSIDLLEANFVSTYWDNVFLKFVDGLKKGYTPNPDLDCNKFIKFSAFADFAFRHGFDKIATGHYARISPSDKGAENLLLTAMDEDKDQSYFLASISPKILSEVIFPVGNLKKTEVRQIAKSLKLPPANRKSSTGICFIGKRNFKEFISNYIECLEGRFIDIDSGEDLGLCSNIYAYTYGQRPGIGGMEKKTYVVGKNIREKRIYVSLGQNHGALYANKALISGLHWLSSTHYQTFAETGEIRCHFKARYRQTRFLCTISKKNEANSKIQPSSYWSVGGNDDWENLVHFESPAFAITPQQAIVFYDGDICIASATIVSPCRTLHEQGSTQSLTMPRGTNSSRAE